MEPHLRGTSWAWLPGRTVMEDIYKPIGHEEIRPDIILDTHQLYIETVFFSVATHGKPSTFTLSEQEMFVSLQDWTAECWKKK